MGGQASEKHWPVDHNIFVYEDVPELLAFAVPFIKRGLAEGARCICVFDDLASAEVTDALARHAVDVDREIGRKALALVNPKEWYGPFPFDTLRALDRMRRRAREARTAGFGGLRVVIDRSWTIAAQVDEETIAGWEALIEHADMPAPVTLVCMYGRTQFNPTLLRQVIQTHGKVIAGDRVYLSLSTLFQNLATTDLQRLLRSAKERRVPGGGFYFHQGEQATDVYVLTAGRLKGVRVEPDGRSAIVRLVMPTEPFGYFEALAEMPRVSSAQALEDSRALAWDVPTILQAMMTHPEISLNAVRVMADAVRTQVDRAEDLATPRIEQRLARLLHRLAAVLGLKQKRGVVIRAAFSGQDLAEMIGSTPYTVSRILADWRRMDIVDAQRERILVLDPARLAEMAGKGEVKKAQRIGGRRSSRGG